MDVMANNIIICHVCYSNKYIKEKSLSFINRGL